MTQIDTQTDSPRGLALAIGTYLIWGFLPLYMHAMAHIPAVEIIANRAIWSLPIALVVVGLSGGLHKVVDTLRKPRTLAMAALTATLISANWLIYVWAVTHDRALEAALGYYINPLFSVALGAALLGERLIGPQIIAISLAAAAVLLLTFSAGGLPIVAIALTLTWGIYAYCKRKLPLPANEGFTVEVLLLFPLAVVYLIWLTATGRSHLGGNTYDTLLLIGSGVVTAVPLMLYANAAKMLRLSTIGILQYIAPTMIFLTAVLIFHEPFVGVRRIAFPMIWAALAIYSWSLIRRTKRSDPTGS